MAFIFRSPKSKYWIAGFYDSQGKRRNRSTKETDRRRAEKAAADYESSWRGKLTARQFERVLADGYERIVGSTKISISFSTFLQDWLSGRKVEWADGSLIRVASVLGNFEKHLGEKAAGPMRSIGKEDLIRFRNHEFNRLSPSTVNFEVKLLKMVFKAARRDGFIVDDPSEFVDIVRRDQSEKTRRPFTVEELRAILSVCDPEWRSMVLLSLYCGGQRLSDVAALRWVNIDLPRKEIRFQSKKTHRRMILPLGGQLLRLLESLPSSDDPEAPIHPKAFAIVEREGRSGSLSNQFEQILVSAGLKAPKSSHAKSKNGKSGKRQKSNIGFHALRMTATTLMHDAGIPAATVQAIVGHSSEDVHRVYVKIGRESQERALDALPDLF
jgi:integrase